jgi:hypothetical protein
VQVLIGVQNPYFGKKIFAGSYRCPKTRILVIFYKNR